MAKAPWPLAFLGTTSPGPSKHGTCRLPLLRVLNAQHGGDTAHGGQASDPGDGLLQDRMGGVVEHEDHGHGLALVSFGLEDGRDTDLGGAQDGGDACEHAGAVDDGEADVVAGGGPTCGLARVGMTQAPSAGPDATPGPG